MDLHSLVMVASVLMLFVVVHVAKTMVADLVLATRLLMQTNVLQVAAFTMVMELYVVKLPVAVLAVLVMYVLTMYSKVLVLVYSRAMAFYVLMLHALQETMSAQVLTLWLMVKTHSLTTVLQQVLIQLSKLA
jgi:hypothetical protein